MFVTLFIPLIFSLIIMVLFFFSSKMLKKEEKYLMSSFECGFSSYFFSRFSFSIHFYVLGLIFLFLDLELCLTMPFMVSFSENIKTGMTLSLLVMLILMGLILEWKEGYFEWKI